MTVSRLVSIVIRSMGRPCVAEAIASVERQTHRPLELLVVDATGGEHPPLPPTPTLTSVTLASTGRRLNRPAAANVGLERAAGAWIGFLDDDDFLEPTHVARLLNRATQPDRPGLVYGQVWGLDRHHRVIQQRHQGFNPLIMYYNCQISAMSCLLRHELRDAGHRLDETLETSEDWDFWLRLMGITTFATVHEPTHFYLAEAGTSGTGIGLNRHNRSQHLRFHDIVRARYAQARDDAWRAHFTRLQEGIALQKAGRTAAAIAFYADVIPTCPDEPNTHYLLAHAFLQAGHLQAARLSFRQAIFLNGDAANYYLGLGDTCARLERYDEARSAYASAAGFDSHLGPVVAGRLAALPPAPALAPASPGSHPVARNAPCPCGSGLRYKACHGAAPATTAKVPTTEIAPLLMDAHALARRGANCLARGRYREVLSRDPADVEAMHAHALLQWDMAAFDVAEADLARAAALAPADLQVADNLKRLRSARFEAENAREASRQLAALPCLAAPGAMPASRARARAVHLVSPFENPFGGTERHAREVARLLFPEAEVTLWSTQATVSPTMHDWGVVPINPERGLFPADGVLVFFGSWQTPPAWVHASSPQRIVVVHNVDNAPALLDLVLALHEQSNLSIELLMPSAAFLAQCNLPGVAYPTPIDLERFRPASTPRADGRFRIGRMSRNVHLKFHPDDPELFRALAAQDVHVRVMGGTVLLRHFPPVSTVRNIELMPVGAEDAVTFLQSLDVFFYRTSPLWVETAARVVAEAMATGVPCVCAADVGFAELIDDGVDGFVFDRDDDRAAMRCLLALRDDPAQRAAMGAAARAKAERMFGPALAARIRDLYLRLP